MGTHYVDLGAVRLAYETFGDEHAGPPVLLVHGYTGAKLDWADVTEPLSRRRRVVAYDHRGHGESTHTGDPSSYTFDALTDDLARFADAVIGPQPFDLVGHSMGGRVAMRYVFDHADRVRSLVLMDTFSEPSRRTPEEVTDAMVQLGRERGMAGVGEMVEQFVRSAGTAGDRIDVVCDRLRWKYERLDPAAFEALAHELRTAASVTRRLGGITFPTTVVVGEHDTILREPADVMTRAIPGAVLDVIPGAAHSPQEENTAAWLAAIEAHLARAGGERQA